MVLVHVVVSQAKSMPSRQNLHNTDAESEAGETQRGSHAICSYNQPKAFRTYHECHEHFSLKHINISSLLRYRPDRPIEGASDVFNAGY